MNDVAIRTGRHDRGEAAAQLVILTPLLILLVFLGVQTAIYFHAANVAAAAAAQGAAAGAPQRSGTTNAAEVAASIVSDLDGHTSGPPIAQESSGYISVTVVVMVPRIVPFFPSSVTRTASEPRERFVPESNR